MNAGYADVVKMLDVVAHDFGGDDGFLRHRNVAGPGGNDGDVALAVLLVIALQDNRPRQFSVFRLAYFLFDCGELLLAGASGQNIAFVLRQPRKNLRHLCRCLALPEDYFGHSCAQRAMVIELGKSQVFKRQMSQALNGVVGRKFPARTCWKSLRMDSEFKGAQTSALSI